MAVSPVAAIRIKTVKPLYRDACNPDLLADLVRLRQEWFIGPGFIEIESDTVWSPEEPKRTPGQEQKLTER